ncbi:MAG: hypothetical protein J6X95_07635 [Treponema sp.]|nr:hypothetical protein [Treponema sp.]
MAKITNEDRELFKKEAKQYEDLIKAELDKEKEMLATMKGDAVGVEYKKLILAEQMIYIATLYNAINSASVKILDVKNNDALNEGRKILYKSIIYLEEIVTNIINAAQSDVSEKLEAVANTPLEKRYFLIRKLGLAIQMIIDAFGDNSKWKWSFVELEGRFAVVAKNFYDFKEYIKAYFDPNNPDNENSILYLRLIRTLLDKSANAYRDKYELSSRRLDDMKAAINFLLALRRVSVALGESETAEELKKKAMTWKEKMEADQKAGKSN